MPESVVECVAFVCGFLAGATGMLAFLALVRYITSDMIKERIDALQAGIDRLEHEKEGTEDEETR